MEKKINNVLLFTARDGSQLTFRVLFTHYSEKFKKDYAVFYNEADENHLILYSFDENTSSSSNITSSLIINHPPIQQMDLLHPYIQEHLKQMLFRHLFY